MRITAARLVSVVLIGFGFTLESVAGSVAVQSGNNQVARIGTTLPLPLVVAIDCSPNTFTPDPCGGVSWTSSESDSFLPSAATGTTGTNNAASSQASLVLGTTIGPRTITARARCNAPPAPLCPVTFTVTGTVPEVSISSGNNQFGVTNAPLPRPFVVTVKEAGIPAPDGTSVLWSLSSNGGTLTGGATTTTINGEARNTLILGPGNNHAVTAAISNLSSVTFTANSQIFFRDKISLSFDSLPSAQGWTYLAEGNLVAETSLFTVDPIQRVLRQKTTDVVPNGQVGTNTFRLFNSISPTLPFSITMRARVLISDGNASANAFGFSFSAYTGTEKYGIGLSTNSIQSADAKFISTNFDNTVFHDYRLDVTPGVGYEFFVDGNRLATGPPLPLSFPNALEIGDAASGTNALAEVSGYTFEQKPVVSVILSSTPSKLVVGQAATLQASIAGEGSSPPTGNVTFKDGTGLNSIVLGTSNIINGIASLPIGPLSQEDHFIVAEYSGDTNFRSGTSSGLTTIQAGNVVVVGDPNVPQVGQPLRLAATVVSKGPVPGGSVTFRNGTISLGTVPLVDGRAEIVIPAVSSGTHSFVADYSGDANYSAAASKELSPTVNIGDPILVSNPEVPAFNSQVDLTATVLSGNPTPTGKMKFKGGPFELGEVDIVAGSAILNVKQLPVGATPIVAEYSGSGDKVYAAAVSNSVGTGDIVGSGGGGSGCFIATAAYGSPLDSHVSILRGFRDQVLLTSSIGRQFVSAYYITSPPIAHYIQRHSWARQTVRFFLTPLVFFIEHPLVSVITTITVLALFLTALRRRRLNCLMALR
jgi:Bacterial Ig-like domain (group 3)